MTNLTFKINSCKLHGIAFGATNVCYGEISWKEGDHKFQKRFSAIGVDLVELLKKTRHENVDYIAHGYLVKREGTGQHVGKIFENVVLTGLEVVK